MAAIAGREGEGDAWGKGGQFAEEKMPVPVLRGGEPIPKARIKEGIATEKGDFRSLNGKIMAGRRSSKRGFCNCRKWVWAKGL